jgi:protein-disulfide isomerase
MDGSNKTKWGIIGVVSLLFLGFFIWAVMVSKNKSSTPVKLSNSGQSSSSNSASLTLVEFGDFQCPACRAYEPAAKEVRKQFKDKVNFVFKHFPLKSAHPNAMVAAVAAEAAGIQGKFWEFHDLLYENQSDWAVLPNPTTKFEEYALSLDLDIDKFTQDLKDKKLEKEINAQLEEGIKAGVGGTPTFFLNGVLIQPNQNFNSFKQIIDKAISLN